MDAVLERIREISGQYVEISKVMLFGSRARKTHTSNSDYDIAVFTNHVPFKKELEFCNELDDMDILYKVDIVVVSDATDLALLHNIQAEGVTIMDRENKITNFVNAVSRLAEALEECGDTPTALNRDGAIQRFEFSAELAWKACRAYLLDMGYVDVNGPKPVMKEAFDYGLIDDNEGWISILNDRNLTSHIYKEEAAQEIFQRIRDSHMECFRKLARKFQAEHGTDQTRSPGVWGQG